jgi:hypothetical protein
MKKRFNTQHRALAAATLLGLGFIHLHANAQGDIAEIFLEGKLTGPTCTLMAVPKTGGVVTGAANQKIDLGTGNLSAASNTTGIGTVIGANWDVKTILFSLTSDGNAPTVPPTNACNFASTGTVGWDIQLAAADPTLILTDGGKTYLKNAKPGTEGGTDAVVALKGGVGDTATIALNLNSTGTYLSTGRADGLFSAAANGNMSLSAQLVNGKATGKPTAGQYLTPIILAVQYK